MLVCILAAAAAVAVVILASLVFAHARHGAARDH